MNVKQVYELVNQATNEAIGETAILKEDLTNIVDIGKAVFDGDAVDKYVKSLVNHIGKVIFVNRPYSGFAPKLVRDGWEFGSVLEKIQSEMPEAEETQDWELEDGESYDTNIFTKPKASAKFFNSRVTFTVKISITEKQVKQSFSNATQLNAFVSMIFNEVDKSMTIKQDGLIRATVNNFIGEAMYNAFPSGNYESGSATRAVNLFYLFKQEHPEYEGTATQVVKDPDFIRFASEIMTKYIDRIKEMSVLYNMTGKQRFTPKDYLHVLMLGDFAVNADTYLYGDTYHENYVKLPNFEKVNFWQGQGENYGFDSISKINVTTSDNHTVEASGILCVMFDRDALMVANEDKRVRTHYVESAEFTNYWFKMDAQYLNDFDENFVVFYVA